MRHLHRELESQVLRAARNFPAVVLTGPRHAGKTFLLRHLLPMSVRETPRVSLLRGGYPEVLARPAAATLWFSSYQRLAAAWRKRPGARGRVEQVLVHRPAQGGVASRAVAPGVQALPWQQFVSQLGP